MEWLKIFNIVLLVIFVASFSYRAVFELVRLFGRDKKYEANKINRYAVLIAARNEEAVIGNLIDSIKSQDYPKNMLDVYVAADNCTDNTAHEARIHGATVFVRKNTKNIGKGYVLQFLLESIKNKYPDKKYDGYIIFDADNLLSTRFVSEINKMHCAGFEVVTGYRNAKNFADNWISASHGLLFLYNSEHANRVRSRLGLSCFVEGTGFMVSDKLLERYGGWKWFMLSEDLEFSVNIVTDGCVIGYCHDAVFYDEQPSSFRMSVVQRVRWLKGYLKSIKVFRREIFSTLRKKGGFVLIDYMMEMMPLTVWMIGSTVNVAGIAIGLAEGFPVGEFFIFYAALAAVVYAVMFFMGVSVLISERARIACPTEKRLMAAFMFPVFLYSFIIVFFPVIFGKSKWQPIKHSTTVNISELESR